MAFVLFHLTTDTIGTDAYNVYDLPDEDVYNEDGTVNEDYLDDLGNDLAFENADSYGLLDLDEEDDEDDCGIEPDAGYGYSYTILDGTREEIEEEYGDIYNL